MNLAIGPSEVFKVVCDSLRQQFTNCNDASAQCPGPHNSCLDIAVTVTVTIYMYILQ